jgi:hypothetical protein
VESKAGVRSRHIAKGHCTKAHQEGRGAKDAPDGAFTFTEGWFRNSGIYELDAGRQMELMEWFIEEIAIGLTTAKRKSQIKQKKRACKCLCVNRLRSNLKKAGFFP